MNNLEIATIVANKLNEKKGENVIIIDIKAKSSFADYLILCTGGSKRQVQALVDETEDLLATKSLMAKNIEGKQNSDWILMDYGDIVINILTRDARSNYNIEKVWGDCPVTQIEEN